MPYSVPQNIDPNKIFLVNFSELEGRWDPTIFQNQFRFISKQYTNRKLSSVALIDPKVSFSKLKDDDDISFIPMNIVNEDDGTIKESLYKKVLETKGFTRFQDGDLIWAKITPCMQNGKSAVVRKLRNGYGCGSTEFFVIRPKDDTLLIDYVYILLRDNRILQTATNYFGGSAGQQRVSKTFLENLTIPVPPLHIQQQIVNVYNAALSQRKKKLSESKAKLASIDQYLLGELGITLPEDSHEKTFIVNYKDVDGGRLDPNFYRLEYSSLVSNLRESDFCKVKDVVVFSDEMWNQESLFSDYFPYLEISGINLEYGQIEAITLTRKKDAPSRAKMILRKGDLIVSLTRPMRGAIAIFDIADYDVVIASTGFSVIRDIDSKRISKDYLCIVLKSSIVLKQFAQRCSGGNYPAITQYDLGCVSIPLPSLDKQQEIADHISAIRAEANAFEQEANAILKQAKKEVEELILG